MTRADPRPSLWTRRPSLALRNILHGGKRSIVAIVGTSLATVLVLLQLGFLEAVRFTAAVNYDQLNFDLALVSSDFEQFYDPGQFPRERLRLAAGADQVEWARPLYARMNFWRCPPYPLDNLDDHAGEDLSAIERWWLGRKRPRPLQRRELLVLGAELDAHPFRNPIRAQIEAAEGLLRLDNRLLLNERSNPDFGWDQRDEFDGWEVGQRRAILAGGFTLTRSFGADAAVLCSAVNFARNFGLSSPEVAVSFGLVKLAGGADSARVASRLNARLPADVRALTRAELYEQEEDFWVNQTATGRIFGFGVLIALLVAAAVIYQVLSADIRDHLSEYATLKALGYANSYLVRVVLIQAIIYGVLAYLPAVAASYALYRATEALAGIPMVMTASNLALVFALTLGIGFVSGLLTMNRLRGADPADLY
ncbi:FtsX-like permease family protein [Isosphaeraceae bacterium EP7]